MAIIGVKKMRLFTTNSVKREQTKYLPDLTWSNCWKALQFKKNSTLILSCKKYAGGVSPKSGKTLEALRLLLALSNCWYFIALRSCFYHLLEIILPGIESNIVKEIISGLLWLLCLFAVALIVILRFIKWVPAEMNHKYTQ